MALFGTAAIFGSNLRTVASLWASDGDVDIWWGEDIVELYNAEKTLEEHRALGRAFGYREDCILRNYPDPWWKRIS